MNLFDGLTLLNSFEIALQIVDWTEKEKKNESTPHESDKLILNSLIILQLRIS